MIPEILITKKQEGYELLDSGDNEKLERFGKFIISRPDPQALWEKNLSPEIWKNIDAYFPKKEQSGWQLGKNLPKSWTMNFGDLTFIIKPSTFKHVGIFPEQLQNWDWMKNQIKKANRRVTVLNLFGYTGGATLACAQEGAEVVHLDASKVAITWGKENALQSKLQKKPIRWILDDARVFLRRELRRERKYDGIILDPPAFGHGPNGEVWKIEEHMLELLTLCKNVLSDNALFFLINGYASGYSSIAYKNSLEILFKNKSGTITHGELTLEESKSLRLLPAGIFARWSSL